MKKAFTLIEILIVLIIVGILATITTEILLKVYENYYQSKEYNRLNFQTDLVLNKIASKLRYRVKNSLIADECNISNSDCKNGNIKNFNAVSSIPELKRDKYKVLEWLGIDIYSKRGMWDDNLKSLIGYSGFVDLKKTKVLGNDRYVITTPFSNFNYVKEIDSNYTKQWGIDGDIFDNKLEVLVFSGPDDRGDFLDVNNSYGFWKTKYPNNKATRVFKILNDSNISSYEANLSLQAIDESNSTTVYQKYNLINSAYAIVPVCINSDCNEYNLTLRFNYYPWNNQDYTDGNSSIIATHVTQFKYREENGILRIYICIQSPKIKVNGENLQICKEKVVF